MKIEFNRTMVCRKNKLDKIKAMMIVAKATSNMNMNFSRKEKRIYFCNECKAWHTTSKK